MPIIRCPVCDRDHQGSPTKLVEMLVECGVLTVIEGGLRDQCPCGYKEPWPKNMIDHLTDTFHDWPALLVRRTLEDM